MSKKIIKGICLVATLLLFTMSMDAATANGVGKSEKKVGRIQTLTRRIILTTVVHL